MFSLSQPHKGPKAVDRPVRGGQAEGTSVNFPIKKEILIIESISHAVAR